MHFSKGQIIFALIFFIAFVCVMIWAYRADRIVNRINYNRVWLILVVVIIILALIKIFSTTIR